MFLKVLYGVVTSIQDLFCDAKVAKFQHMIAAVGVLLEKKSFFFWWIFLYNGIGA